MEAMIRRLRPRTWLLLAMIPTTHVTAGAQEPVERLALARFNAAPGTQPASAEFSVGVPQGSRE